MDGRKLNERIISKVVRPEQYGVNALIFIMCIMVIAVFLLVPLEQSTRQIQLNWRLARDVKKFNRNKTILMWVNFFGEHFGQELFDFCPELSCHLTYDRSSIAKSSAVVFHDRNVNVSDLPKTRLSHQHFVFFLLESPYHVSTFAFKNLSSGFYTLTMTYRSDSDVHIPYGFFKPKVKPPPSTFWDDIRKQVETKKKLVAWFVSNCVTPSGREDYVNSLREYIEVDVYGLCSRNNKCALSSRECLSRVIKPNYKFYIAFENSVCTEYVTEKYFDRLNDLVVPIVFDRKIYETVVLNNSFIAADDFDDPKALADYLIYLDKNTDAYLQYFKWMQHYDVMGWQYRYANGFCKLCQLLHDEESNQIATASQTAKDVMSWYSKPGTCHDGYGYNVHKL